MRLSIVTITRNQAEYLPTTIRSVLSSRIDDLQYIIYDAASTDQTADVVESLRDPRVEYLRRSDSGPADGLNYAFAHVDGDLVGYINGDDFYLPNALEWVVAYFEKNPEVDLLHGGGVMVDAHGNLLRNVFPRPYTPWLSAVGASYVFQQASFFRVKAIKDLRFNTANHTCWDGEFVRDFALRGSVIRREVVMLGAFRIHRESITGSPPNPDYAADRSRIGQQTLKSPVRLWHTLSGTFIRVAFYVERLVRGSKLKRPDR